MTTLLWPGCARSRALAKRASLRTCAPALARSCVCVCVCVCVRACVRVFVRARAGAPSLSHMPTLTNHATGAEHDAGAGEDPAAADGDGHRSARVPQCVGCGCCDTDCLAQAVEASPRGGYACVAVPSRVCARMSMVSAPQSAASELTLRRPLTPWLRGV